MSCNQTKSLLSPYLDGRVTGKQMRDTANEKAPVVRRHGPWGAPRARVR